MTVMLMMPIKLRRSRLILDLLILEQTATEHTADTPCEPSHSETCTLDPRRAYIARIHTRTHAINDQSQSDEKCKVDILK